MDAVFQTGENNNTRRSSSPIKSIAQDHELRMEHVQTESTPQENHQLGPEHRQSDNTPQENNQFDSEHIQNENTTQENYQPASEHVQSECAPQESDQLGCKHVQSGETMLGQGADSTDIKPVEHLARDAAKSCPSSSRKKTKVLLESRKRTYMLRSSVGSARVLRSRSCGTSKAPVHPVAADRSVNVTAKRKEKRKKKLTSRKLNDEFSRTRKRLRYFLHRMSFEQSLIDAYSGEGWKGQSLEKIKPEKELQRATTEIFSCKQKIRSLFQHIDSSCAEGKLQESLFDSDGQISYEDISCAKCGSKDLTTDNDIILCDGMCDRGFHQMCLEPPLLKEEIPPGDEGWLCPGCDCKVDCIDLLNDSQGMDLSIDDHWEKVFPEAAATVAKDKQNDDLGLPSDDSEDDDYDPDGPQDDAKVQSEDSSSEESDFSSASEDSTLANDDLYMGLPSDDSEDDDYDPNGQDHDEQVKKESSSSDFTCDSEDFGASDDDSKFYGADEVRESLSVDDAKSIRGSGERSTMVRKKKQSVNSELQSLLEADPNATLVSGKRNVERLDYKQLHDETYGNVPSDSSGDEDWTDGNASRKGKSNAVGNCTILPKRNSSTSMNGTKHIKQNSRETENTPKGKTCQKLDIEGANELVHRKHKDSPEPSSSGKLATASPSRLGKAVTQRLSVSLRENQYPDRATKEKLVKELGITIRQVSKWFENARRSLRLSANIGVSQAETTSSNKESILTNSNQKDLEPEPVKDAVNNVEDRGFSKIGSAEAVGTECCSGNEERRKSTTAESSQRKPATPQSRKRKGPMNDEKSDERSMEKLKKGTRQESPRTQTTSIIDRNPKPELKQSGIQTRSRKSTA
ncbi:homeobox protein HOX1A-like [Telopea speciosissima]|uniref:homeobox protein HOX1A-like n=1 Tax=Telopea speciosissima TaxID=54955 RepID=UPI001CC5B776|nr:homeobox protein HOX1A-like [Telopea speciosissima]XP_043709502.1 homeobox protein HOX1A-like [Telopea speciosissima]